MAENAMNILRHLGVRSEDIKPSLLDLQLLDFHVSSLALCCALAFCDRLISRYAVND